jgi:hypothetical protein
MRSVSPKRLQTVSEAAAMELRHLRYFVAVAEEGSVTLARSGGCIRRNRPSAGRSVIYSWKSAPSS